MRPVASAVLLAGLLGMLGCGASPTAKITTYPVKGKLTLADGKPVPQVDVLFDPKPSPKGAGWKAVGKTNDNGEFELNTLGDKGAGVGLYAVSLSIAKMKKMPPNINKVPKKYWDSENTPLEFEVQAKDNEANLILK